MVDFARYLEREQTRASERHSAIRAGEMVEPEERIKIIHGDFREVLTEPRVASGSVDLILTDPPYAKVYLLWATE
jgi:DNA modification methylase